MRIFIAIALLALAGCSSDEPKESDKLLLDYKNKQLEKAKQVEEQMQKRVENLDQQLEQAQERTEEDEPH